MNSEGRPHHNTNEPKDIDQTIRINELTEQVKELGIDGSSFSEDCPDDTKEQFLKSMIQYETAPLTTPFDDLVATGIHLPPPSDLDDRQLATKLWELIEVLSRRGTYLYHTNHLSDRELYERLWTEDLREVTAQMPPSSGWSYHLDMIGSGSDEHIQLGLMYYDSEESRQHWAKDFPSCHIPPHVDPPFDRDRLLPKHVIPHFDGDEFDFDNDEQ